jgi:hypothetical protein
MNTSKGSFQRSGEQGAALLVSLGVLVVVGALAATLATLVGSNAESEITQQIGNQSFFMAESGARYAIAQIRKDRLDAVDALDGHTFELGNGWGFQLAVQAEDMGTYIRFRINSTGFVSSGSEGSKQQLNGYQIDVPKADAETSDSPTSFNFAMQIIGGGTASINGSSYIDSYDSAVGSWNYRGEFREAIVYSTAPGDVLDLGWSTHIYGHILVPEGSDTSDPYDYVNRPENVLGDPKVVAGPMPSTTPISAPDEDPEAAKPISWNPVPNLPNWGTHTIPGGAYDTSGNLAWRANITATGNLDLDIGRDLSISSGGGLNVNGDFRAWVDDDFQLGGNAYLNVHGDADFQIGGDWDVGRPVVIDGDLDLDVAGDIIISGGGSLHVKGDVYFDVGEDFIIRNGGKLTVDGKVIIHAGEGFSITGNQYPLVIGPDAAVQVYVDSGIIAISSAYINLDNVPAQFLVFGGSQVTDVDIDGSAQVAGGFHAPTAEFALSGSSHIFGAVVAESIQSFGGDVAIHYDEALARLVASTDFPEQPLRRYWVTVGD